MKTLVWVEHDNASVKDATYAAVTAASKLGEVHLLVAGAGCRAVADEAAHIAGVGKVHLADDPAYGHALAENVAPLVAQLMAEHDAVLFPATTNGKNIAPRVAALLDVMQISDILSFESADTFTRPIYAGNAVATVQTGDRKLVITVRGTAFEKAAATGGSGSIETVAGPGDAGLSTFAGAEIAKSERPELTSAKVIVLGRPRAAEFGELPRADRAAGRQARRRGGRQPRGGRRGLCPQRLSGRPDRQDRRAAGLCRDRHLGRDPAPRRHEGFQDDHRHQQGTRDAPIFQVADIGLVGDLFKIVPVADGEALTGACYRSSSRSSSACRSRAGSQASRSTA